MATTTPAAPPTAAAPTGAPPTEDGPPEVSRQRINAVFAAVALGMLLAALDQTIVSTALPTIVGDLGGAGHLSWVVTGYLLAETVATALVGKFGDLFGRKRMFLVSVVVFLVGSFCCGFAGSMLFLIAFRAVQGLGAGGLMVTSAALIADVIPLRERGRYQGALGSVFGVVTVIGPLLGGLFVDHLSWRWAFYVNIPVGVIVLAVAVPAIPAVRARLKPVVDYWGIVLVALGASGLTLVTSWGGTTYPWLSPTVLGVAAASIVALVLFVLVERRAAEPVLPMRLFANPVFRVAGPMSFIVGFAMLGGITFLPTFLQYVKGTSATTSGIRMLPMVVGLLIAAIASGNAVSRTGKYRVFPIVGSAGMAIGLYLLSRMDENTGFWESSAYMFVLGVGVGLTMQVLLIAVQNTVAYEDLGVATSGVTFLRTIGSSFGVAVFGSVYSGQLGHTLPQAFTTLPPGTNPLAVQKAAQSPQSLHALPAAVVQPIAHGYAQALHVVFLAGVPVAVVAFVLSWLLRQVPMRGTSRAAAADLGDGFAMPESSDPDRELERTIAGLLRKEKFRSQVLTRADSPLSEAEAWCVVKVRMCTRRGRPATIAAIAQEVGVPAGVLEPAFERVMDAGYLESLDGELRLTSTGEQEFAVLAGAWQEWVTERLADWNPELADRLPAALARIARRLFEEQSAQAAPAGAR